MALAVGLTLGSVDGDVPAVPLSPAGRRTPLAGRIPRLSTPALGTTWEMVRARACRVRARRCSDAFSPFASDPVD